MAKAVLEIVMTKGMAPPGAGSAPARDAEDGISIPRRADAAQSVGITVAESTRAASIGTPSAKSRLDDFNERVQQPTATRAASNAAMAGEVAASKWATVGRGALSAAATVAGGGGVGAGMAAAALNPAVAAGLAIGRSGMNAIAPYSGSLSLASARADMSREQSFMNAGNMLGGSLGRITTAASGVETALLDGLTAVLDPLLEILTPFIELGGSVLKLIEPILKIVGVILKPVARIVDKFEPLIEKFDEFMTWIIDKIDEILSWFEWFDSKDDAKENARSIQIRPGETAAKTQERVNRQRAMQSTDPNRPGYLNGMRLVDLVVN